MSRRQAVVDSSSSSQRSSSRLVNNGVSSNSELKNGRKRPAEDVIDLEEENTTPNNDNEGEVVNARATKKYDVDNYVFPRNDKDVVKFEALPSGAQSQCIKAVCRLFIMKGAKRETVNKETIRAVLKDIDEDYKKHLGVVLSKAQVQLNKSLGYIIVSSDQILGMKRTGKSDEYFVSNNLNSPKLMKMLNEAKRFNHYTQATANNNNNNNSSSSSQRTQSNRGPRYNNNNNSSSSRPNYNEGDSDVEDDNDDDEDVDAAGGGDGATTTIAFVGFVVLVCGTIYTSQQKKITGENLLAQIRKVDPRFPPRLKSVSEKSGSACPVPELEQSFLDLIKKMQKEHYLIARRSADDHSKEEGSIVYSLGPRFYLDVGRKPLMLSYFQLMDMPIDEIIMKEIEEDAQKEQDNFAEEEEEEEVAPTQRAAEPPAAPVVANSSSSSGKSKKTK